MKRKDLTTLESRVVTNYCPVFEFHIARSIRSEYQIDDSFFSTNGRVIFANFYAAREFVHKFNLRRHPNKQLHAGNVNALGVMEEILHLIVREYEKQTNADVFAKAERHLQRSFGKDKLHQIYYDFLDKFPANNVYRGQISIAKYLAGKTDNRPNTQIILEESIMLFLANLNPAIGSVKDLCDEKYLDNLGDFKQMIDVLEEFFKKQQTFGYENQDLISFLISPASKASKGLYEQLDYIYENWSGILPESAVTMLLKSQDFLKEENRINYLLDFTKGQIKKLPNKKAEVLNPVIPMPGEHSFESTEIDDDYYDYSLPPIPEKPWMGEVVLLAKNINVWLSQLSLKYVKEISHLDQIPDTELEQLQRGDINALWLVGIWERSGASRRLKHIMGHIDADASAYSLHDYEIAQSLGGMAAYHNLNKRAALYGIRLACDFIPNHTAIDSKWIIEHPDYFIQTSYAPFPSYRFTGPNLSSVRDFEIRIEEGYFSKNDAAVVFQVIDVQKKTIRYIYHGNDGTLIPWNDTAQLDMLKHEVRQAVIQKVLDVAEKFTIIRFDAAMTIARQHFARLWYPAPGTGGAIASRVDYSLTKGEFEALFPVEFWNELADRVQTERPDILLLGEVFWHMENVFIRNKKLHRVYNAAFMQMLRDEENVKYRSFLSNALKDDPAILQRYINYMSNPDEDPAIVQFGSGEKYFGVCVLMCTLPGLPMFAHGQIDGYAEKYGMEYKRPLCSELPDPYLIDRHEREIFPLIKKRYLFWCADNFYLYNLIDSLGIPNENVIVFTNKFENEKALIVFNNHSTRAEGIVHFSEPKINNISRERQLLTVSIAEALGIDQKGAKYHAVNDHISGLEYILSCRKVLESGIHFSLRSYECRVLWDFRELDNTDGKPENLYQKLGNDGVVSIERELKEMF